MRKLFFLILLACIGCQDSAPSSIIGRDPSWYPHQFGVYNSSVNAFINSMIIEVNKSERLSLQISDVSPSQLMFGLEAGQFQAILSTLPPTLENQKKYAFSHPILPLGPVLVVPNGSPIRSISELHSQTIGINQFSNAFLIAQKNPNIVIKLFENMVVALEELSNDEIDAVLISNIEARQLIPKAFPDLEMVSLPLDDEAIRLLSLKKDQALIERFNEGLKKAKKKSAYRRSLKTFGL